MKRLIKFFSLSVALVLILQVPASAESLQDNLVPQDRDSSSVGEVDLKYNEYPQHHYELDTYVDTAGDWMPWNWADGAGKQIYIALMEVVNAIWSLNVLLANFTMLIVQEAFNLDFISGVVDQIAAAIQNVAGFGSGGFMSNGLWPLLVTFIIAIVGAWATYVGMVKRESSRAWGGLVSSLVIFVFSLGFFSNADKIIGGINDWSSDLQSEVLGVSASIVNPDASYNAEEGIASTRNQMFDLMVKKPYLLMQYGTTEVDEDRVNSLLEIDPFVNPEERQNKVQSEVEDEDNTMMSIDGITQRAAFVPLLFVGNTIIGVFLLMISGSIILYQMIFLVLVLFAPVPLLMALVPRWQQTAFDWMMKVIHAQLMKIAIALLLTILFGISAILYRATERSDMGYLGMMILQIICFVGVWAKRRELFNMVSTATNNVQSSTGATLQSFRQKYNQARNVARKGRDFLDSHNGRLRNQPLADRKNAQEAQGKIGYLNREQLANRKKIFQGTKEGLEAEAGTVGASAVVDRNDLQTGQEMNERNQNRKGVMNANVTRDQLMDRQSDNGKNQTVGELKRGHSEGVQNHSKGSLGDHRSLHSADWEVAAMLDQSELQNADLINRSQSVRNVILTNQHDHEDRINEQQNNQIVERRTMERNTTRDVSEDIITRERNINNTVNRTFIDNENNEHSIHHVTERSNQLTEVERRVHDSRTERESGAGEVIRRREQSVSETMSNDSDNHHE